MSYLRCLTPIEVEYATKEVHERIYGSHLGALALAHNCSKVDFFANLMNQRRSNDPKI